MTTTTKQKRARKVCVLCQTEQPDLNRHGECVECVDAAEGTCGF